MDVAYLFATVNQLRTAYQLAAPYESLVVGLLIFSLVLQVTSSILLLVEKMSEPMSYTKRKKYVVLSERRVLQSFFSV